MEAGDDQQNELFLAMLIDTKQLAAPPGAPIPPRGPPLGKGLPAEPFQRQT